MNRMQDIGRWKRVFILIVAGLIVGWITISLMARRDFSATSQRESSQGDPLLQASASGLMPTPAGSTLAHASEESDLNTQIDAILIAKFDAAAMSFQQKGDLNRSRAILADLAETAAELDPTVAAQTLIAFLESGRDAETGLEFRVADGGVLGEAPSLRVAALDLLGRTGSPEAAEYAVGVMDATSVADEYSVALRNLAWGSEDNPEIGSRFSEMLDHDDWLSEPTAGFIEAFDVAVAIGGSQMVREISQVILGDAELQEGGYPALNRPAFIALDRLMLRDPGAVVEAFRSDPELLSWAPMQRASVMSRVNLDDPAQRVLLENYLLTSSHSPGELEYFQNVFPNVNGIDGFRMVTEQSEIRNVNQIDAATRRVLNEWRADSRFKRQQPMLDAISQRLGKEEVH